ncbi:M56 family metallopeptidase [Pedobacter gandavensis]|uniref:M56 family metallopeptidase n=1 Tax=Pedobacter gandavensis TaxID=2679963 RepID=UPI00292F4D9A|nr:M56 family metallopeptidase [Pedobacter gandavensis]
MMNWFYYLLEANLYLAVFYGCYRLLLHNETFYSTNRFFLILSTLMAFSLPLLQIGYLNQLFESRIEQVVNPVLLETGNQESAFPDLDLAIYVLYSGVAIFFILKLLRDLYQIFALSRRSKRYQKDKVTYVILNHHNAAFSFFNLLFIQSDVQGKETILKHELVHIRQGHSLDIIFFEIIQILNWFNPITYLIKKDIKLLHEYIADEQTTLKEIGKYDYALFLIKNSFGMEANPLSNHIFNQSVLKQRINMLNKEKSTGRARLKILFALPIAAAMLGTSTMAFTKDYSLVDLYPERVASNISPAEKQQAIQSPKNQEPVKPKPVKTPKFPPPPPPGAVSKIKLPPPPPPPGAVSKIKFPPPIITRDKKPVKKTSKSKKNQVIKFAAPIVRDDKKVEVTTAPTTTIGYSKVAKEPAATIRVKGLSSKKVASNQPILTITSTNESKKDVNPKPESQP